jgi:protein KTI12
VIITGGPCVGKTSVAHMIQSELEEQGFRVQIVSDDSLRLPRRSTFADAAAEKQTRAAIKAAVERFSSPGTVVIVDSLNYIKGFRYELSCISKRKTGPNCVVHVIGTKSDAMGANRKRAAAGADSYTDEE